MADSLWNPTLSAAAAPARIAPPRHAALVRITHWLTALASLALLVTGLEIVASHPRFYWGETGNIHTTPLFRIPIPSSRASVPTGYGYVLPDQNGWSRYLHFQSAWLLVFTGAAYLLYGLLAGHFRRNLLPTRAGLSTRAVRTQIARDLHFRRPPAEDARSYNPLQRLTYLAVIFILFPLIVWTGLAMSPAVASATPALVTTLGGQQSARTLHFFLTLLLVLFLLIHIAMIWLAGFRTRMRAMITGRAPNQDRS